MKSLSRVQLFATPWTIAYQAPPSMGFSRQESWSGLPFPSPGDLPDPGIETRSSTLQADALTSEPPVMVHFQKPYQLKMQIFVFLKGKVFENGPSWSPPDTIALDELKKDQCG